MQRFEILRGVLKKLFNYETLVLCDVTRGGLLIEYELMTSVEVIYKMSWCMYVNDFL